MTKYIEEILEKYPIENADDFRNQFIPFPEGDIIQSEDLRLRFLSAGSDKQVYKTKHPNFLLKAYNYPSFNEWDQEIDYLFLPFYEFIFPTPLADYYYLNDKMIYGCFQLKTITDNVTPQIYLRTREINKAVASSNLSTKFAQAIIETYSEQHLMDALPYFKKIRLSVSNSNWGWYDGKPYIFDSGVIK